MNPVLVIQIICRNACLTRSRCDGAMTKRQNTASELMMRTEQSLQRQAFWKSQAAAVAAALPLEDLPTDAVGISAMQPPALAPMPEEVLMICHQFDTSKQRASEAFATARIPTKQPIKEHGYVTTTVLVQQQQRQQR